MTRQLSGPRDLAALRGSLVEAATRFGTPLYLLDAVSLAWSAAQVETAFPDPWIRQYSLKANDLPAVVTQLAERGWGANVVSSGEWQHAAAAGVADHAVTFEGIGKTDAELDLAVQTAERGTPLRWLALESADEAHQLVESADRARLGRDGRPALDVLLRLNPQVEPETLPVLAVGARTSKFGMDRAEIMALVQEDLGRHGLLVRGIHVHAGSDLRDVAAWAAAGASAVRLLRDISSYVDNADTVDFGGGFPLAAPGAPTPAQFHAALVSAVEAEGLAMPARRAVEPGRYLVGSAGWLVSRVLHSRHREPHRHQVVLDAGMTELIRPALYGSRHGVHALHDDPPAGAELRDTAVEGPVCESTDSFGSHPLPPLQRGDLVAIEDAGAYAGSFTSRYNGRPQPTEVVRWPDGSLHRGERPAVSRPDVQHPTAEVNAPLDLALSTKE